MAVFLLTYDNFLGSSPVLSVAKCHTPDGREDIV